MSEPSRLPRPSSRLNDTHEAETLAYAAGRRDAEVDAHLRSHEQRLNAINGSIDRHAREATAQRQELASLRETVEDVAEKVGAIAGALQITAAVDADRGKRAKDESEQADRRKEWHRWVLGSLCVLASGAVGELLHLVGA